MSSFLDAIRRLVKKRARIVGAIGIAGAVAACGTAPPITGGTATPPTRVTVSNPVAGLAQMAIADVQQGISDLTAAGATAPNAPLPLADSLTCGNWLLTAIPQAQIITAGAIPSFQARGPYSLFIEGKIAAYNIKGIVGSAQSTMIDTFNHFCGSAVAGDVNAVNMLLLKVGIGVIPGGGVLGGLLPGL